MASCCSAPEKVSTSVENKRGQTNGDDLDLGTLFSPGDESVSSSSTTGGGREGLIAAQSDDPELRQIRDSLEDEEDPRSVYYLDRGVLMRRWTPPAISQEDATWTTIHQVLVPKCYRNQILSVAHDNDFAGHLGTKKTLDRI